MSTNSLLDQLNPMQREAAEHTDGPLLIVAGAGAGKTRTLTYRIANLIETGVAPHHILAITFTNKAAAELRERLRTLLANQNQGFIDTLPTATTFHSLGVRILREFGNNIGLKPGFAIIDRSDQEKLVKQILKELGYGTEQWTPKKVLGYISNRRSGKAAPLSQLEALAERYTSLKTERSVLDFDDLIFKTEELLSSHAPTREALRRRWSHLHVDEYQDTNTVQYNLVQLLSGDSNNVCVVGDTDQTIYTWRGAEIKNLMRFEKDFPGTKTVLLEENYRCSKTIIAVANDCIRKNKTRIEKTLFTNNPDGEEIEVLIGSDEADEAKQIARKTKELISEGVSPSEIAILYRANFQSQAIEKAFISMGLQYDLLGTKFYQRKEVKDMLAYLRYATNPDNLLDLERIAGVPKRGVGPKTVQAIYADNINELGASTQNKAQAFVDFLNQVKVAVDTKPPHEVMEMILEESGWATELQADKESGEDRLENLAELINVATDYKDFEPPLGTQKLLEEATLMAEQDTMSEDSNRATRMMTIHASKGLEFEHVFVTGLEEGLFPSDRSESLRDQEEERRLFYVALTRAKKAATLSYATMRRKFGSYSFNTPSEFITEINPQYLKEDKVDNFSKPNSGFGGGSLLGDIQF